MKVKQISVALVTWRSKPKIFRSNLSMRSSTSASFLIITFISLLIFNIMTWMFPLLKGGLYAEMSCMFVRWHRTKQCFIDPFEDRSFVNRKYYSRSNCYCATGMRTNEVFSLHWSQPIKLREVEIGPIAYFHGLGTSQSNFERSTSSQCDTSKVPVAANQISRARY